MAIYESGEMYLETILILSKRGGPVRSLDVAEYMNFSKPSVSRAIGLLRTEGYVAVDKNGHLSLTGEGQVLAEKIYKRHRLLTDFLTRIGVEEALAAEDACKMEHCISDTSLEAIRKLLETLP